LTGTPVGDNVGPMNTVVFPFVFTFPNRPVNVYVTLHHEAGEEFAWIFVEQKLPAA
jgi:hypothetical protein